MKIHLAREEKQNKSFHRTKFSAKMGRSKLRNAQTDVWKFYALIVANRQASFILATEQLVCA